MFSAIFNYHIMTQPYTFCRVGLESWEIRKRRRT